MSDEPADFDRWWGELLDLAERFHSFPAIRWMDPLSYVDAFTRGDTPSVLLQAASIAAVHLQIARVMK